MGRLSRQREAKQRKAHTKLGTGHPIEDFFTSYSAFTYIPSAPSGQEFQRLRISQGWKRGDVAGEAAWEAFRLALVKEFNVGFGTDASDLLAWQTLCAIVGIERVRQIASCEECEKVLKSRHFNLVDLVDVHRRGENETIRTFASAEALEQYTRDNAAYFPRYHEAAGNLLRRVLRRFPVSRGDNATNVPSTEHSFREVEHKVRKSTRKSVGTRQILESLEDAEDRD
ncbi:hypothetical protein G7Y89_g6318 [Cudoniella acicularis]|uniref:Uncharacterized protein n=1 Tax=Cudoniella acicularis TaxID=354080 RepID=A0A8H4RKR0_9HELO|nr:hypothetical protein G7Y89_g6318 [Cudoniella acicularis]